MNELDLLQIIVEELAEMKSQPPIANLSEEDRAAQSQISKALTGIYELIKMQPKNSELQLQLQGSQKLNAELQLNWQQQQKELQLLKETSQNQILKNQSREVEVKAQDFENKFRLVSRAADKFASRQSLTAYIIGAVGAVALIGSLFLVYTIKESLGAKADAEMKIAELDKKYPNYDNWLWVWRFENEIEKTKNIAANRYYWKYRHDHPAPTK